MKALVFDVETTGLPLHPSAKDSEQPRIIEFGGALVDRSGAVLRQCQQLVHPGQKITEQITKITGITNDDLQGAPDAASLLQDLEPMFREADAVVAHNLPFDAFLVDLESARHWTGDWPWPGIQICTVQEHAEEWGRRPKLTELYEHYTGRPLHQTHRALDDVMALVEVCVESGVLDELHSAIARAH